MKELDLKEMWRAAEEGRAVSGETALEILPMLEDLELLEPERSED